MQDPYINEMFVPGLALAVHQASPRKEEGNRGALGVNDSIAQHISFK